MSNLPILSVFTCTKLKSDITAFALVFAVEDGNVLPTPNNNYFYMDIVEGESYETVKVLEKNGNYLTVARGVGGTLPRNFVAATPCGLRINKAVIDDIIAYSSSAATWGKLSGDIAHQTDLIALLANYSLAGHNHDVVYSKLDHTHNYALVNHVHDTLYAPIEHYHDLIYSRVGHTHEQITQLPTTVVGIIDGHLKAGPHVMLESDAQGNLVISAEGSTDAGSLVSGTLNAARLPNSVVFRDRDETITGKWDFDLLVGQTISTPHVALGLDDNAITFLVNGDATATISSSANSAGNNTGTVNIAANKLTLNGGTLWDAALGTNADTLTNVPGVFFIRTNFL